MSAKEEPSDVARGSKVQDEHMSRTFFARIERGNNLTKCGSKTNPRDTAMLIAAQARACVDCPTLQVVGPQSTNQVRGRPPLLHGVRLAAGTVGRIHAGGGADAARRALRPHQRCGAQGGVWCRRSAPRTAEVHRVVRQGPASSLAVGVPSLGVSYSFTARCQLPGRQH
jgi:hypothetical protein